MEQWDLLSELVKQWPYNRWLVRSPLQSPRLSPNYTWNHVICPIVIKATMKIDEMSYHEFSAMGSRRTASRNVFSAN